MLLEKREDHEKAIASLVILFVARGRGSLMQWSELEAVAGGTHHNGDGKYRIRKARKVLLREHGIATRSVPNVGVRILTPSEQVIDCSKDRQLHMIRETGRAINEVASTDDEMLPLHHRHAKAMSIKGMRELRHGLRETFNEVAATKKGGVGFHRKHTGSQ